MAKPPLSHLVAPRGAPAAGLTPMGTSHPFPGDVVRLHSFWDTTFIACTRESCVSQIPSQGAALLAKCTGGHVGLHLWMPLVTAGISSAQSHGGSDLVFTVLTLSYRSVPLCPSQRSNLRQPSMWSPKKTEQPSKRLQTDLRPQTIFAIASTHPLTFKTRGQGED